MQDPVSTAAQPQQAGYQGGICYERFSIAAWFAAGNSTCPVTNVHLADQTLTPNRLLRDQIREWQQAHAGP